MSEGKGFNVIVKLNLAPVKQYASGNSVIFQGDTVDGVAELIGASLGLGAEQGQTILRAFGNMALAQAAGIAVSPNTPQEDREKRQVAEGPPVPAEAASTKAAAPAAGVDPDGPASAALLAVVASKTGHSVEELGPLTTKEAKKQLAIAKSKATKAEKEKGE